jgi:predicted secreted protein
MNKSTAGLLLLLSALPLLLTGIAGMGLLSPATFSADDNGKTVSVNLGDTFLVKLPENPATGHAWDIKLSDGLTLLSDTYKSADQSGMKVGVGGTHTWEIKATKNGTQTVRGIYRGPGNQSGTSPETYVLTVDVSQGGLLSGLFRMPAMLDTGTPGKSTLPETVNMLIRPGDNKSIMPTKPPVMDIPEFRIIPNGSMPLIPEIRGQRAPQELKLSYTDVPSTDEIGTLVGDTIRLTLPENPSTGYSWQMTWSDGLEKISDNYVQGNTGTAGHPLVGAPGTHEWVFKVTQPEPQKVTGVYKRPWEGSSAGEKTYVLSIDVI